MALINAAVPAAADPTSLHELPNLLRRWITIEEEIATFNAELKQRKTTGKALKEVILRTMETHKIATLNINRGALTHRVTEKSEPVNNAFMLKHFTNFFSGDGTRAKQLMEYLETNRGTVTHHDLKLVAGKEDDGGSRRS